MDRAKRLCLIHMSAPLVEALSALGHEVLSLHPPPGGVLHLPTELARHGFTPDVVIQQEVLQARTLLAGLDQIPALRVFWALDPHLNAFWQAPYARLFDLVFSTQRRNIPDLTRLGAGRAAWLPWFAPDSPFRPFAERGREAGFVGRLGPTRPVRQWLVELMHGLLPGRFEAVADIPYAAMLDFTKDTRLIPNESIAGEVNFRLFEAAGYGCVVLAQDLGPEQAELFEPGREMLVCADALELAEAVRTLTANPRLAEALGRAAWARAQADHLPLARAKTMLAEIASCPRNACGGDDARRWLALALAGLYEAGRIESGGEALARDLAALPVQDTSVLTARLRTAHRLHDLGETARVLALCEDMAADPSVANAAPGAGPCADPFAETSGVLPLNLACSMLALRQFLNAPDEPAHLALARLWAARSGLHAHPDEARPPAVALLLAWADRAEAAGLPARAGFSFDVTRHLPANATECLFLAQALAPEDVDVLRRVQAHLDGLWGADALRLGVLSSLGLRARGDWRTGLATALCDLRVFRLAQGLSELALARHTAAEQGQAEAFAAALAAADPTGRLRTALG